MSATTLPLARSMRATVHSSWLATHSDPPPTARLWGLAPVLTGRPNSRLVQGSIRATLSPPVPALVTQTALGVAARSSGARGTVMVATVRPVARSMRAAVSLPGAPRSPEATVMTHSAPWATAMAAVSAGTRRALPTTRLVAGTRDREDGGEPAPVEGGQRGRGGRGRRLGRWRAACAVGGAGAPGSGQQHRHHQQLVPTWTARRPAEVSANWHGTPRSPDSGRAPLLPHQRLAGSPERTEVLLGPPARQAVVASQRSTIREVTAATAACLHPGDEPNVRPSAQGAPELEKRTTSFGSVVATQTLLPTATTRSWGRPRVR